ncbi:hypothetical protein P152DRAFT_517948 [Eremomyces bilateralis CBS 781.70]|uniref:Uncharacterized protein n=1 Tax=Eremomyces bilateralis CBS 781.70 TaxID=1392243 RepID=A0A6G1FQ72_9PEZI|nr:uncharacterized protein P152DRAFT_517948 [Eremomyces bilateralis CBS 781.70]KAF1807913.1 hypothetical protein P152DRAFT_517948 [Eremomyces bilateralis CBS 781.70]
MSTTAPMMSTAAEGPTATLKSTAVEGVYVPPPGFRFRLQSKDSGRVLVGNGEDDDWRVTNYGGGKVYDDQWFTLRAIDGHPSDEYYLQSADDRNGGRVVFSRQLYPGLYGEVGLYTTDHKDQHFKIEPGTGDKRDYFRLIGPHTKRVIFSRDELVSNYELSGGPHNDHYFKFLYEDTVFDRVEYDIDHATVTPQDPVLFTNTVTNETDASNELEVDMRRGASEVVSFEEQHGINITETVTTGFGIPGIVDGEVTTGFEQTNNFTFGRSNTITYEVGSSLQVTVPPHSIQKVEATLSHSTIDLPARIYSKSKTLGIEVVTDAIYHGTPYYDISYRVLEPEPWP